MYGPWTILESNNFHLSFLSPHDIEILKAEMEKRQPASPLNSEEKAAIEDKASEEIPAVPTNKTDSDTAVAASSWGEVCSHWTSDLNNFDCKNVNALLGPQFEVNMVAIRLQPEQFLRQ